jgi:uncharacterized protein (DUF1330 family)
VVQTLHAQAKPPAYNVAEITIKDQNGYNKEYLPLVTKAITDAGEKFIVRGGKTISYEGAAPAPRVVVVQFENLDKLQALYNSASYRTPSQLAISTRRSAFSASKGSRRRVPPHPTRCAAQCGGHSAE